MACYNNCYLPRPPRDWSRVQNSCSVTTGIDNNAPVRDPYTKQIVPATVLAKRIAMLNKGNILQYKANSSNLTKTQRYSKIATGQWVNRNTTWATQSMNGYTNPNSTSLKRSGNVSNIAIDPITGAILGPTTDPLTCPQPITIINEALPSNGGGGSSVIEPDIPPPIEPTPASETFPPIIADTPTEPIVIQDGGFLICSVQENPCTGETKTTLSQQLCNPTTDSDVPGTIQELCWNDGTQTWYPRSRYIMTNSTNKWPTNAVLTSAVILYPPTIISILSNDNIVTLIWTQLENCLPVSVFYIFQNNRLIQTVPGTMNTTDIVVDNCNTYSYFIVALTNGSAILSEPSNTVIIDINYLEPPTDLDYAVIASGTIQLTWNPPRCVDVSYNIYQSGVFIGNTPNTAFTVNDLINCNSYSYYVVSLDASGNISAPSNTLIFQLLWPGPPDSPTVQEEITATNSLANVTLNWNLPVINECTNSILTYNLYFNDVQVATDIVNLTYTFIGVNFYDNNKYGVQSSAIITGTTQTSEIVNTNYTVFPFTVEGSPTITILSTNESIIQYTNTNITNSINFLIQPTHFNYIIVGGGGGGGAGAGATSGGNSGGGGGGGAGEIISNIFSPEINTKYSITVGDGGSGCYLYNNNQPETKAGGQSPEFTWGNGQNSSFENYMALGGYSGQGAVYTDGTSNYSRTGAAAGGLHGGGKGCFSNPGGGYKYAAAGINGTTFDIYGNIYTIGGGGGGGSGYNFEPVAGGGEEKGGDGGCGGDVPRVPCVPGNVNTGGGGGGGGCFASNTSYAYSNSSTELSRNGGSGTVILYFDYQ